MPPEAFQFLTTFGPAAGVAVVMTWIYLRHIATVVVPLREAVDRLTLRVELLTDEIRDQQRDL